MALLRAGRRRKSRPTREATLERQYRLLCEAARSFVFRVDLQGRVTFPILPSATTAGRSAARSSDRPFSALVLPDDLPRAQDAFARALAGEAVERFVLRLVTPSGAPTHVELTLVPEETRGRVTGVLGLATDVTGRVLAEEKAARADRLLVAAQHLSHLGSWEWDTATGTVSWSEELYRIHGLWPHEFEVTPESALERVHPEDHEKVQAALARALSRPGSFAYDARIRRAPDGALRILESHGETVVGPDGRVSGLIGTCLDVTARREREDAIRVYQEIFEEIPIGLTVWRVEGSSPEAIRLLAFNKRSERALSLDLIGKTLPECLPASRDTPLAALLWRVVQTDTPEILPHLRYAAERIEGVFEVMAFPLGNRRVAVTIDDITQRVLAEEALAEAEEKYRRLLESVQAIVWRGDPRTHRFSFVSKEAETLLGYPVERWLTEPSFWLDHLHPEDREWVRAFCLKATAQRRDHQFEARFISLDGRVVWLRDIVRVIHESGVPRESVGVMIDVTERRLAEEEVERSREQLRDLSAHAEWAREEERAAISRAIHDELGQAMTALKMDLSWLGQRLDGDPGLGDRLAAMTALADDTINRVRRIARELRPGVLDDLGLEAALQWQAQDFEGRTGIRCAVSSRLGDLHLPRDVATGFFRTFQEALTNVVRHAEARRVDVRLDTTGGRLSLEVTDDGRGISDEALSGRKSLGLVGMHERARRLGGDLVISGAPGQGTMVMLSVPLPAASRAGAGP